MGKITNCIPRHADLWAMRAYVCGLMTTFITSLETWPHPHLGMLMWIQCTVVLKTKIRVLYLGNTLRYQITKFFDWTTILLGSQMAVILVWYRSVFYYVLDSLLHIKFNQVCGINIPSLYIYSKYIYSKYTQKSKVCTPLIHYLLDSKFTETVGAHRCTIT